jgi:hypothetical protein
MGTGSFARQSETPINRHSTFAKSAGASATQEPLETIQPLRSIDREQSPSTVIPSVADVRTSGAGQNPQPDSESEKKTKRKRLLLLLLLLLITFTAAFLGLSGGFGTDEVASVTVAAPVASAAPEVVQSVAPEKVVTEEAPKAIPVKTDDAAATPPVEDERLPEERIATSMIPARIADVTMPETQYNISYPAPIPPPPTAVKSKTNFVAFEVNAKLAEDPDTRVFSMVPSAAGKGTASLAWSTLTGAVLFRCKDLRGNTAGSNYVLYYIDENDKAQRMMAFAVASGAELMLIPSRIPARGVKRVVLTLEKNVKTLEGMALHREEVLYSDYKEKAILTKPLK